jgi:FtsZ-binding cell division protein ZapB
MGKNQGIQAMSAYARTISAHLEHSIDTITLRNKEIKKLKEDLSLSQARCKLLEDAMAPLVEMHKTYKELDESGIGGYSEAYYSFVKHRHDEWNVAIAALGPKKLSNELST